MPVTFMTTPTNLLGLDLYESIRTRTVTFHWGQEALQQVTTRLHGRRLNIGPAKLARRLHAGGDGTVCGDLTCADTGSELRWICTVTVGVQFGVCVPSTSSYEDVCADRDNQPVLRLVPRASACSTWDGNDAARTAVALGGGACARPTGAAPFISAARRGRTLHRGGSWSPAHLPVPRARQPTGALTSTT
jgi:hypothetical protein